jgi:hypothetical protein
MTAVPVLPIPVKSTLLASVLYHADQSILDLEFCDGSIYRYFAVPTTVLNQLLAADSKGSFFNRHVRNCFQHTCLKRSR